jgi:hypothetical protein
MPLQRGRTLKTASAGPTAHRSVGPGDSIEESGRRLQFTVEHRMKTNSCRPIVCIMTGPVGCDNSVCVTVHGVKKRAEPENVFSIERRGNRELCINGFHTI